MTTSERTLLPLSAVEVAAPRDVVHARQRARHLAALLGFASQDQARIATATSEVCRNAFNYARKGRCEFALETGRKPALVVRTSDQGPGIDNLDEILAGRYRSPTGMGLGLIGTRRLMDRFEIHTQPGQGTEVMFAKELPPGTALPRVSDVAQKLSCTQPDLEEDLRQVDQELMRAIAQLRARNEELEQIREELEETNRGVVALYAELDEKAVSLRKATELKSRFLSNMSHEFRTPLSSIQSLARIVLDGAEGAVSEGQRKAVELIRRAAADLTEMVNDLLDLAKIEAGKIDVRPADFDAAQLFAGLRGMLRPLLHEGSAVQLVFDPAPDLAFHTDDGKVSQIMRNFVSNALKFTERGEVRVGLLQDSPGMVTLFVRDTGIGIAPEDQERIFEEFTQIDGTQQKRVKGTGLGLPLSRRLAQLLGGDIYLESEPSKGSTFFLRLPLQYGAAPQVPRDLRPVLALVDDAQLIAQWDRFLDGTQYRLVPAKTLDEARAAARSARPAVVIAAPLLAGDPTRPLLAELRSAQVAVLGFARAEHDARLLATGTDLVVRRIEERHELLELLARALRPRTEEAHA